MSTVRPIPMPIAFVCPIRVKFDVPTDRPGDLEAWLCPFCWHPHFVTGRRGMTVIDAPCCGRPIRLLEGGEITVKARLLRGSDQMPELQKALAKELAVAAMLAARHTKLQCGEEHTVSRVAPRTITRSSWPSSRVSCISWPASSFSSS
jgi:hypothetical protein